MTLDRRPKDPVSEYLLSVQESGDAYAVCYHKPPHPHTWCGAIYWTEQELVDTYNTVSDYKVETAQYITFCPWCLTYFSGYRPQYLRKGQ